jgi:hypothetical protein
MEIVSIDGDTAVCVLDDISINASISLVPEAMVGDYAIVYARGSPSRFSMRTRREIQ